MEVGQGIQVHIELDVIGVLSKLGVPIGVM